MLKESMGGGRPIHAAPFFPFGFIKRPVGPGASIRWWIWSARICVKFRKQGFEAACWGKWRSGQSRVEGKRLSGYGSRIRVRRAKGVRKARGPWRVKEDGGSDLFPHQIGADLHPHFLYRNLNNCILAAPTCWKYSHAVAAVGSDA